MTATTLNPATFLPTSKCASLAALAATCITLAPTPANAGYGYEKLTSDRVYDACIAKGINEALCYSHARFIDPVGDGVTSFHFKTMYDTSRYIFDPSGSGPIGPFAVGGDIGPGPGSGTELLQTMPVGSFKFGTTLPGSTYSYTDLNGILTVDMTFSDPVHFSADSNVLLLNFKFITPMLVDLSKSYVTYDAINPGSDFTTLEASCTTTSSANACGSDTPTMGVTTILIPGVPEPESLSLVLAGLSALLFARKIKKSKIMRKD